MVYVFVVVWVGALALFVPKRFAYEYATISGETVYRARVWYAVLAMLPIILWAGFRSKDVADTIVYIWCWQSIPRSLGGVLQFAFTHKNGIGFWTFMGLFKLITESYRAFFVVVAIIEGACVIMLYWDYSSDYLISIFLFIITGEYVGWMMNGIRQFMAVCIICLAAPLLLKRKYFTYALAVVFAVTIHPAAVIMLPIAFVARGKAWNGWVIAALVGAIIAAVFSDLLIRLLQILVSGTELERQAEYLNYGTGVNPIRVLVYSLPALISLLGHDQIVNERASLITFSVNMSVITMALYLIGMRTNAIMLGRLPIFTSMYNYILLPYEIGHFFEGRSARLFKAAVILLYLAYYYYMMHFAYQQI